MKTVLLVAFRYPPFSSSGAWRPYFLIKHLIPLGWRAVVLTIQGKDTTPEAGIELPIPGTVEIRTPHIAFRQTVERWGRRIWPARQGNVSTVSSLTSAQGVNAGLRSRVSDFVEETLLYPDDQMGWAIHAIRAGWRAAQEHGCDVIYATGGPWSSLLIGIALKRILQRPLVVEFRDPWYGNAYHQRKFRFTDALDLWLEKWVLKVADRIVVLTQELGKSMIKRYGVWLDNKLITITNGFESDSVPLTQEKIYKRFCDTDDKFRLIHAGALYGKRDIGPLIMALAEAIERGFILPHQICLDLVGEVEIVAPEVLAILQKSPMNEVVNISPRVPFLECQKRLSEADLLVLLQPDAPLQIPRKLFDYLAFGKPILAITSSGATANLISGERLGEVVPNEKQAIIKSLINAYQAFQHGVLKGPEVEARERFTNRFLAARVDHLLGQLISASGTGASHTGSDARFQKGVGLHRDEASATDTHEFTQYRSGCL